MCEDLQVFTAFKPEYVAALRVILSFQLTTTRNKMLNNFSVL